MTRPLYAAVRSDFLTRTQYPRGKLLELLGWDDLLNNPAFEDTCAMRISTALSLAGVDLIGARMKGRAGRLNKRRIEPDQSDLSRILRRRWGEPEKFRRETEARSAIGKRGGVVSFFRIHPNSNSSQGHIDLIEPRATGFSEFATQCYFTAVEIWFWPLR